MKRILLSFFIVVVFAQAQAQDTAVSAASEAAPLSRPRTDELNKESSSFMGDPDPLDPLPVKKENLKEDDEPVLDDIRQVLDAPAAPKKAPVVKKKSKKSSSQSSSRSKSTAKRSTKKKSSVSSRSRDNDAPDERIENQFYQIYKRINSSPTPAEAWSAVSDGRKSEIYVVQKGDTLWTISQTLFGDPNFWPKIWALNKQGITNPHIISPGLKIYFYPGTTGDIPSLAVGGENFSEPTGELAEDIDASATHIVGGSRPTPIPDTLPLYRNDRYFKKVPELVVELENQPEVVDVFRDDIILADKKPISEVTIPLASISNEACKENVLIKNVTLKRKPIENYTMLEYINSISPKSKEGIHAYRIVGTATASGDKMLRILSCSTVLSTEIVMIQTSLLPQVRTQKISEKPAASLLGGPDVDAESLFTFHQYAYLDLAQQPIEVGQVVPVKSQVTDSVHGQVKIISKSGSYAVGVIIDIEDTIATGDTLVPR